MLEPSPPAIDEPPFFADDPVAGGEVVPVVRAGARSWSELCDDLDDADLRKWCEDRWLVRGDLAPLPPAFPATRHALHRLAEHVIAPCRHAANGKIGLRFTSHGFGTPFFGDDRQLRVDDGELVDGDRRQRPGTLRSAGELVGLEVPARTGVYTPTTSGDLDDGLHIDAAAGHALGDWFGFCASVLEQLRAEATEAEAPSRVQLWPEHFDLAVDLGLDGRRANYGGSPGDDTHPEPYLYVGPWAQPGSGGFWNEPFGASLSYRDLLDGADPLAFFRTGKDLLLR